MVELTTTFFLRMENWAAYLNISMHKIKHDSYTRQPIVQYQVNLYLQLQQNGLYALANITETQKKKKPNNFKTIFKSIIC